MKINPARHPRLWDIPPVCRVTGLTQQFWMKIEKKKKKGNVLRVEQRYRRDSLLMTTNICLCFVSTLVHLWPLKSGASRGHTQSAGNSTIMPEGNTHTHTHAADTLLLSASAPSWQNKIRIRPAQIRDLILICPDFNHNWKPATRGHTQRFNILIKFP